MQAIREEAEMGIKFICHHCREKRGCNPENKTGGFVSCLSCKFRFEDSCPADDFEIKDNALCDECANELFAEMTDKRREVNVRSHDL